MSRPRNRSRKIILSVAALAIVLGIIGLIVLRNDQSTAAPQPYQLTTLELEWASNMIEGNLINSCPGTGQFCNAQAYYLTHPNELQEIVELSARIGSPASSCDKDDRYVQEFNACMVDGLPQQLVHAKLITSNNQGDYTFFTLSECTGMGLIYHDDTRYCEIPK